MRKMTCMFSLVLAALMPFLTGCEDSDVSLDDITFRNNSSYSVTVTVRNTASNVEYRFMLAPNGEETKYAKVIIEPLSYNYWPSSVVSDRRDGDDIIFENR